MLSNRNLNPQVKKRNSYFNWPTSKSNSYCNWKGLLLFCNWMGLPLRGACNRITSYLSSRRVNILENYALHGIKPMLTSRSEGIGRNFPKEGGRRIRKRNYCKGLKTLRPCCYRGRKSTRAYEEREDPFYQLKVPIRITERFGWINFHY